MSQSLQVLTSTPGLKTKDFESTVNVVESLAAALPTIVDEDLVQVNVKLHFRAMEANEHGDFS